jgi:hypothetical protein
MDAADEKAARLLPCLHEHLCDTGPTYAARCSHCRLRPAVAAALRCGRSKLNDDWEHSKASICDACWENVLRERDERIAALAGRKT